MWLQCSKCGLTHAESNGRFTALELLLISLKIIMQKYGFEYVIQRVSREHLLDYQYGRFLLIRNNFPLLKEISSGE